MSNTTVIDYEDTEGAGNITLVENPFRKGSRFNAKFDRVTVNIDNLIARIQKKEVGTNAIMAKHFASLFKAEILEALGRGEAVNFLDLGTFYIAASVTGDTPDAVVINGFQVRFTASKILNDAVSSLKVKKIALSSTAPIIGTMKDLYTGEATNNFSSGKSVRIEGSRLKIAGEEGGVFFAPSTEDEKPTSNTEEWIKVEKLIRNSSKELEFFLPASLELEKKYCIVLKTSSSGKTTKKSYSTAVSAIVSIQAVS